MLTSLVGKTDLLQVDVEHPFFFDHPLDHVPGLLMVHALIELVQRADDESAQRASRSTIQIELRFDKICEFDPPPVLTCSPDLSGRRRWSVSVQQQEVVVCFGTIGFDDQSAAQMHSSTQVHSSTQAHSSSRRASLAGADDLAAGNRRRAPAGLVHRRRPENVMVSAAQQREDLCESMVLTPPEDHWLPSRTPDVHVPLEIIEAGRQFVVMMEHQQQGRPEDVQMLWLGLHADIPTGTPLGVPLVLQWAPSLAGGPRSSYPIDVASSPTGSKLGSLVYECYTMSAERYARMRSA